VSLILTAPVIGAIDFTAGTLVRGLLIGTIYGLLAVGLVLVYRSSQVVNFAHAELGLASAAICEVLVVRAGVPFWLAMVPALAVAGLLGALCEYVVARRLANAPRVLTVVATLGLSQFLLLFTAAFRGVTTSTMPLPPGFPEFSVGNMNVNAAFSATLVLGPLCVVGVALLLAKTQLGLTIRGASTNPDAARLAGISPGRASATAWAIAGVLSGLSAVLITGALGAASASTSGPSLLVRALAAAVLARFVSIPKAFFAALVLGIVEQAVALNVSDIGVLELVVYGVIVIGLLTQPNPRSTRQQNGSWLSLRTQPGRTWRGQDRWIAAGVSVFVAFVLSRLMSSELSVTFTFIVISAAIGLSVYVITGLGGQLSLGQYAIAVVGGVVGIRAANASGDLLVGVAVGAVVGALTSVVVGLPALRLRGLDAAVTTLGFAVVAREWLLSRSWMAGFGVTLEANSVLGLKLGGTQNRFVFAVGLLSVLTVFVSNIASSGFGRRIRAIRDNEDQARGFSIGALVTKLSVFALAGAVAGASGLLIGLVETTVAATQAPSNSSITAAAGAVIGGLGSALGPIVGSAYLIGVPRFLPLDSAGLAASSLGWLALVIYAPAGIMGLLSKSRQKSVGVVDVASLMSPQKKADESDNTERAIDNTSEVLVVSGLQKSYGGVAAVAGVDLVLRQGETLGLIGANGAGKTTLFELIAGFGDADGGTVTFGGRDITKMSAEKRAQLGLIRSFQGAGLFPTFTVKEVILTALERHRPTNPLVAMVGLNRAEKLRRKRADELITMMGLQPSADAVVSSLSTGTRRITELACMLALEPKVLLLDEPSSGIAQRETEALADVLRVVKARLGTSLILIEHDMPFLRSLSDRVVAMERGSVIATGTAEEVLADQRVIDSYLGNDQVAIDRSGVASSAAFLVADSTAVLGDATEIVGFSIAGRREREAARRKAALLVNRQLGWLTLPFLLIVQFNEWAENRISIPLWVGSSSNLVFTIALLAHLGLSVYSFGIPRPRWTPKVAQVWLGYGVLLFIIATQVGLTKGNTRTIAQVPMWFLIAGHVAVGCRFWLRRRSRTQTISTPRSRPAPIGRPGSSPVRPAMKRPVVPAAPLAVLVAIVVGIAIWTTRFTNGRSVIQSGFWLAPTLFVGIALIHVLALVCWFILTHAKPQFAGFTEVWIVPAVTIGLIYDNLALAAGNVMGESNTLRLLNIPRYWVHATCTPLVIFMALAVARRCGLQWANGLERPSVAIVGVIIAFSAWFDGFTQELEFTTKGGVTRYANEVISGPPIGSIAVIAVMLVVGWQLWQRGFRATTFGLSVVMLIGAGLGASLPLVGNAAEVCFVGSMLSGIAAVRQADRVREPRRVERPNTVALRVPWVGLTGALLGSLLAGIFISANVDADFGPSGTPVVFVALAVALMFGVLVFVRMLPVGQGVGVLGLGALGSGVFGAFVVWAALHAAIASGNVVGIASVDSALGISQRVLSTGLCIALALTIPALVGLCIRVVPRLGSSGVRSASWIGSVCLAIVGGYLTFTADWAVRADYATTRLSTRNGVLVGLMIVVIAVALALTVVGWLGIKQGAEVSTMVCGLISLVIIVRAPGNPFVVALAGVALLVGFVSMARAAGGHRRIRSLALTLDSEAGAEVAV
jgi:ABC-type branched-subunit amino acid transport system ATPase component/branched-subunit amino acid ABC-type transport system permease component